MLDLFILLKLHNGLSPLVIVPKKNGKLQMCRLSQVKCSN
jgi:hypothetical protein